MQTVGPGVGKMVLGCKPQVGPPVHEAGMCDKVCTSRYKGGGEGESLP